MVSNSKIDLTLSAQTNELYLTKRSSHGKDNQMNTVLHSANTRGHANHGWLNAHHSFSFASWYNPERVNFGVLRVLNDDIIAGGMGFGTHPHDNMEIITIPLTGSLTHQDSMGNKETITAGEIQVMSAGTGVQHSEYNGSETEELNLFQIWLFPNNRGVEPRYDQQFMDVAKMKNNFAQILSPNADDEGVWIHQNAWFHMGDFEIDQTVTYTLKDPSNGIYVMIVEGNATINEQQLNKRDALGVWDTTSVDLNITAGSKILILEVPMNL